MKDKKRNQMASEESEQDETSSQQNNGSNGTVNIKLTEEDQEKGNFKNFTISKKTIKKLKARNVECLFPVQTESYTAIYEQTDCLIQSSKGSGKTFAFVLPVVELLQSDKSVELVTGRAPRVLVLTATRETTKQISDEFQSIVNDLAIATIFTSKKKTDDQETAVTDGCDILVATPDRLKEFIDDEKVDLSQVKHVILDDVDQVLDDIKKVLKNVFTSEPKAQLIVVSETSPDAVRKVIKKFLSEDVRTINLAGRNTQATADDDEGFEESSTVKSANTSGVADDSSRSLLSKQENYTTYQLSTNDEIKGVGFVFATLRKCLGDDFDAKGIIPQIAFTKDFQSTLFDLPSEYDEQLQGSWKDSPRMQMAPITQLPELDEASMNDHNHATRGNDRSARGGGGNRNAGRSNTCFKCQKEGHKSFECPDANGSQRNGGNRFGGGGGGGSSGGCFNCGKDGHRSFECTEPKKAGGRPGGGDRSNGCFNCGKDGHKSYECTEPKKAGGRSGGGDRPGGCFNCGKDGHKSFECSEPKKAGGREQSNACFNCGQDGHKSFDCPEPKKGRPSFGSGGRGGGGGGRGGGFGGGGRGGGFGGGAKRSFGGGYDNGQNATREANNKKIKFGDDDEE